MPSSCLYYVINYSKIKHINSMDLVYFIISVVDSKSLWAKYDCRLSTMDALLLRATWEDGSKFGVTFPAEWGCISEILVHSWDMKL